VNTKPKGPRHRNLSATASTPQFCIPTYCSALTDPQYASVEATKRSGSEKKSLPPKPRGPKRPRTEHDGAEGSTEGTEGAADGADFPAKSTGPSSAFGEHGGIPFRGKEQRKGDQRGKKWESAGRPRPGAALAMAKREKVGIVEAQGSKITFD
jgi:hypothetical protein